jgi:hypothetical protein
MSHAHDLLPQTQATSALVRRMVWRLNAALLENGHTALSNAEHAGLFDLATASYLLDRVALLPRMEQHEERMRRDLLELFAVFNPLDPLEQTIEQPGCFVSVGVQVIA